MPRNHRDIDAEVKRQAIEQVAERLLLEHGYEATSMAAVAREAGVAPNTLYWYFGNKDELLIAVLNRLVAHGLHRQAKARHKSPSQQMAWLLDEFDRAHHLVATVHTRADVSDAIREWHEQFHRMLEHLLVQELVAQGMRPAEAQMMATVNTYVMEGLLSHGVPRARREALLRWLSVKALAGSAPGAAQR